VLIFPSEWYETFGRVAVESFAKATPAIAANIEAIAELADHGRIGFHFRPGDPEDLAAQVERALNSPSELAVMRREARRVRVQVHGRRDLPAADASRRVLRSAQESASCSAGKSPFCESPSWMAASCVTSVAVAAAV
jgi:hypothetical protein